MADSIINAPWMDADIRFIAANNDISTSFGTGARNGPAAVRACLDGQIEFFEHRSGINARDRLKIGWTDFRDLNGNRTRTDLDRSVDAVRRVCAKALHDGAFPFVIGGDHSNAIGALAAAIEKYGAGNLSVLHIDAHHDLRRDDSDFRDDGFGPNAHCSALRRAADEEVGLVQVGIRAYSQEEAAYAKAQGVKTFYWGRNVGFEPPQLRHILDELRRPYLYITVDVDGFDPAVMPATGTPVPGGLTWQYGNDLLLLACGNYGPRVVGADICEVAPRKGCNLTEYAAAQLAYNIVCWRLQR